MEPVRSRDLALAMENTEHGEFYEFCKRYIMPKASEGKPDAMSPQPHEELCKFIADMVPDLSFTGGEQRYGLCLVPRGGFKTTIGSIAFPLWVLTKNHNARILISSHRHDASKSILNTIKWHIENNELLDEAFGTKNWKPQFRGQKWSEEAVEITVRTAALRDPTIDTAGVDRSKVGAHPDLVIVDDAVSETNSRSKLVRDSVLGHIQAMYPMLEPGGSMLVIGTRWHPSDAYATLMELDKKAVEGGETETWHRLIRGCYDGPEGLYFPAKLTHDFLNKQRKKMTDKMFAVNYLNQPIEDSHKVFPKHLIKTESFRYLTDTLRGQPLIHRKNGERIPVYVTIHWDPAGANPSDKSDFHGVSVVGQDSNKVFWVIRSTAARWRAEEATREIINLVRMFHPRKVTVEGALWLHLLRQELSRAGQSCYTQEYVPARGMPKFSRIETRLEPLFKNDQVILHDKDCTELIDQLDDFPELDYDDVIDSLAQAPDNSRPAKANEISPFYEEAEVYPGDPLEVLDDDWKKRNGTWAGRTSARAGR